LNNEEKQPQVLRLRLAPNHPGDEDLSPGAPVARQTSLRMTAFLMRTLETGNKGQRDWIKLDKHETLVALLSVGRESRDEGLLMNWHSVR
jgi:hypothetical protein